MTQVNRHNLIEQNAESKKIGSNPFSGIGKFLDSKFNNVFSAKDLAANDVNKNPFSQLESPAVKNTESLQIKPITEIDGHSLAYAVSPNSVFDVSPNQHKAFEEDFRNAKFGNLDFNS